VTLLALTSSSVGTDRKIKTMGNAPHDKECKDLLKAAEMSIIALQEENAVLKADLDTMIDAQAHEADQMVQMSEQLWKLEEALMSTTVEKDTALMMLDALKSNVSRIQEYAEDTLNAVRENKSRLKVAAQVYEIKSMVETLDLKKKD